MRLRSAAAVVAVLPLLLLVSAPQAEAGHTHTVGDWYHGLCCPINDGYSHAYTHSLSGATFFGRLEVWYSDPDWPGKPKCFRLLFEESGLSPHQHTYAAPGSTHDNGSGFPPPGHKERYLLSIHDIELGQHFHRHHHHDYLGSTAPITETKLCGYQGSRSPDDLIQEVLTKIP